MLLKRGGFNNQFSNAAVFWFQNRQAWRMRGTGRKRADRKAMRNDYDSLVWMLSRNVFNKVLDPFFNMCKRLAMGNGSIFRTHIFNKRRKQFWILIHQLIIGLAIPVAIRNLQQPPVFDDWQLCLLI